MPGSQIAGSIGPDRAPVSGPVGNMASKATTSLRKAVQFLGAVEYLDPMAAGLEAAKLREEAEALGRKLRRFQARLGVDPGAPFPWEVGP